MSRSMPANYWYFPRYTNSEHCGRVSEQEARRALAEEQAEYRAAKAGHHGPLVRIRAEQQGMGGIVVASKFVGTFPEHQLWTRDLATGECYTRPLRGQLDSLYVKSLTRRVTYTATRGAVAAAAALDP
jgi:hypothetical protein